MATASGFFGAPLSKVITVTTVAFSIANMFAFKSPVALGIDQASILTRFELWRLFTCQLGVRSPPELVFSLILLYRFREFERRMGTPKFAALMLITWLFSASIQLGFLVSLPIDHVTPGPYPLIFALFVYYHQAIPKVYPSYFRVLGVNVSDKTLTYMIGLQLLLNDGMGSAAASISGIICGLLHLSDALSLSRVRLPKWFYEVCKKWIYPLIRSDPPGAAQRRRRREIQRQQAAAHVPFGGMDEFGGGGGGGGGGDIPPPPPVAFSDPLLPPRADPNPESVQRLVEMGFDRTAAEEALAVTDNNEEAAANRILMQM